MRKKSIERLVKLPLTPLRFVLSAKLMNLEKAGKAPENIRHHLSRLHDKLEKTELTADQLADYNSLSEEVGNAVEMGRPFADTLWELIFQLEQLAESKAVPDELKEKIQKHLIDWRSVIFPFRELDAFCDDLQEALGEETFDAELENARQAISKGYAPEDIMMDRPAKQLLWAAHVVYLLYNPEIMSGWQGGRKTKTLAKSQLWRQLLSSHNVKYLRALFGSHIFNLLRKNDILVGWGPPGSWFSYRVSPPPGRVLGDLLYSMVVGFDHARACVIHEISHAVQTQAVPEVILEINAKIDEMEGKKASGLITNEERIEVELLKLEKQYRNHFLNALEDNCVNRFTENIGQIFGQDYGYSLNYFYTAAGDVGRRYMGYEEPYADGGPVNRFRNLCYIGSRIFLANNDLFPNTLKGWASIKAKPSWVAGRDRRNPETLLVGDKAFKQFINMCGEVEYMFPPVREMAAGPEKYKEKAQAHTKERFELIWEIYDLFAKSLVDQMLEARKKQLEKQQEEQEKEPPQKPEEPETPQQDKDDDNSDSSGSGSDSDQTESSQDSDNARPGQDLPEQPQENNDPPDGVDDSDVDAVEGENGEEEESEPESPEGEDAQEQESQPEEGQEQPDEQAEEDAEGDEGAQDSRSGGDSGGQDQADSEEEEGADEGEEETLEEGNDEELDPQGEEEEGEEQVEAEEGEEEEVQQDEPVKDWEEDEEGEEFQEYKHTDEGEEEELNVETVIDEEEVENEEDADIIREEEEPEMVEMSETDRNEDESDGGDSPGEEGGEDGGDGQNVRDTSFFPHEEMASVADLREALQQAAQMDEEQPEDEPRPPRHEKEEEKQHYQPNYSDPEPMDLDDLASGSWDDFARRVAMHAPIISMMAGALKKLKDAQLKIVYRISKKHTLVPPGGDLRRFDQKRMEKLFNKLASKEKFDKDDLNMFYRDEKMAAATRPSRVILIDGSRSMSMGMPPLPMDKAIQEAVIDYKASELAGYDTYIVMYGPLNPIVIARPGDNPVVIGKNIEQVRGGLNTATNVAPGILQCIAMIAERKKFSEPYVGFTNFVIYSDGDIDDPFQTMTLIEKIVQYAPKTTFDFVLITSRKRTPMDQMLLRLQFGHPLHQIGVVRGDSARKYPMALTATYVLTNRLRHMKSSFADPAFKRSGQFKRLLYHLIQPKQ